MSPQISLISLTILLGFVACSVQAEEPATQIEEMIVLKVQVLEKRPGQEKPVTLSQPMVQTMINLPVSLNVGGKAKSKFGDQEHSLGMQMGARFAKLEDDKYELKLAMSLGDQRQPEDEPQTEIFFENRLHVRTIMKSGETKKITISPYRWCELTINPSQTEREDFPKVSAVPSTAPGTSPSTR